MLFREEDEDTEMLPFSNRAEAGRVLASKLLAYADRSDVAVIGLARGGMAVASEVARVLHAPLDVLAVRKLGVPWHKELAMGAIAPGGVRLLDLSVIKDLNVSELEVQEVTDQELHELHRQEQFYRHSRSPISVAGKTIIIVDDGIATGTSLLAGLRALRQLGVAHIVAAIPVAPAASCPALGLEADKVVCIARPQAFMAISQCYEDFDEVTDVDVCIFLEQVSNLMPRAA